MRVSRVSDWIVSKRDAARFFGVSTQALDGWFDRNCPVHDRDSNGRIKGLSLPDMVAWRLNQVAEAAITGGDLEGEKIRLTRAQADKTELEVEKLRGVLVASSDVERVWTGMIAAARAKLLALPTKAAPQVLALDGRPAVEAFLARIVHEALAELADYRYDDYAATPASEGMGGVDPAPKPDGLGVGKPDAAPERGRQRRTRPVQ